MSTVYQRDTCIEALVFPDAGVDRIRKVVTRSRARTKGKLPSLKAGRMVEYESINERNVFLHLEGDPSVLRFSEQPCRIVYWDGPDRRHHVPDALVIFNNRREFWEVKSAVEAQQSETAHRTALMQQLASFGYSYRIAVAEDFSKQPKLRNLAKLLQVGRLALNTVEREAVRVHLRGQPSITWREVSEGLFGSRGKEMLCRLVLEGHLSVNLDSAWGPETEFTLGGTL